MTTVTVYCDRCAARVEKDRTELCVECGPLRPNRDVIDLCGPCCADLTTFLAAPSPAHPPADGRVRSASGDS